MAEYLIEDVLAELNKTSGVSISGKVIQIKSSARLGIKKWGMIDFLQKAKYVWQRV